MLAKKFVIIFHSVLTFLWRLTLQYTDLLEDTIITNGSALVLQNVLFFYSYKFSTAVNKKKIVRRLFVCLSLFLFSLKFLVELLVRYDAFIRCVGLSSLLAHRWG